MKKMSPFEVEEWCNNWVETKKHKTYTGYYMMMKDLVNHLGMLDKKKANKIPYTRGYWEDYSV